MPFESQIMELNSDQLDQLFESSPNTTPNADTLIVGKDNTTELDSKDPVVTVTQTPTNSDIPYLTDDLITDDTAPEPTAEEKAALEAKVIEEAKAKAIADGKPAEEKTEEQEEGDAVDETQVKAINEVLTNTVEFLVKSGKWVDFDGREDLEITQDVYADLAAKQDEYRLGQLYNELLDSTGDYGKAIIAHIKSGGNPDEIIDLFKEQKQLQQIDTTSEAGKQAKIEKYYSDILGWKPERVEKTIKRLITDNEIESEFSEVENLYDQHYKEELAKTQEKVKQEEAEAKQRQSTFVSNIKNVLKEDTTLSEADKKIIQSTILDFRHKLPNGQKVNDFYIKFAEKQADPKEYIDLVRFVTDKAGYLKSIQRTEETKANQKAFSFVKNGAALTKVKTSPIEINANPTKATRGTDFSFALKK